MGFPWGLVWVAVSWFTLWTGAILWAYGGGEGSSLGWRRVGVPVCVGICGMVVMGEVLFPVIVALVLFCATTMPYGEDSPVRVTLSYWVGDEWADVASRGLCGLLYIAGGMIMLVLSGLAFHAIFIGIASVVAVPLIVFVVPDREMEPVGDVPMNYEEWLVGGWVALAHVGCFWIVTLVRG